MILAADKVFVLYTTVLRWIDGDTYSGVLDLGMRTYQGTHTKPVAVRCALINTPEMSTPEGLPAKVYAEHIAPPGEYRCVSYKPDNYGRPLVDLELPQGMFSQLMISAGHAVLYKP
jgi:endonuclease YncB( thermonuclease family)